MKHKFCCVLLLSWFSVSWANNIIVVGDIGGTNARLRLSQLQHDHVKVLGQRVYAVAAAKNMSKLIKQFVVSHHYRTSDIAGIYLAVAGPVVNNTVKFPNADVSISGRQLQADFHTNHVVLLNDFAAVGYGILTLKQQDLKVLQTGLMKPKGLKAILGAGTGLGVSLMYWDGHDYKVHATGAGGHTGFAPANAIQDGILQYLRQQSGYVPTEDVLSGRGLVNIYRYFTTINPYHEQGNPALKQALSHSQDQAGVIAQFALAKQDPMAMHALDTFVEIYGAKTGDMAYAYLPEGGLYIAGGIAPKILKQTNSQLFMRAYSNKGPLTKVIKSIPVYMILNPAIGLQGMEYYAMQIDQLTC